MKAIKASVASTHRNPKDAKSSLKLTNAKNMLFNALKAKKTALPPDVLS